MYSVQGWESANRQSENNRCLQLVPLVLVSEVTGVTLEPLMTIIYFTMLYDAVCAEGLEYRYVVLELTMACISLAKH